uniref:Uncharacterized protein n=1 Tax=Brassica campestris TaxID=3711 RepID=A0A3P6AWG2_BRACM|nr:unnamed protein product [Brassica rapa]
MFGLFKKSKPQQDVYFLFKIKQKNQRKRENRFDDDEKWVRSGDRPFSKAKRSNCDVFDQNELQKSVWRRCCIRQFMLSGNSKRRETPILLLHQNNKKMMYPGSWISPLESTSMEIMTF